MLHSGLVESKVLVRYLQLDLSSKQVLMLAKRFDIKIEFCLDLAFKLDQL
jgi:hypothetical protein